MTSTNTASQVFKYLYGTDAELTPLYAELDNNFLVATDGGEKRILKIMHVGCDPMRVDLQCRALEHLAENVSDLNLPHVISTTSGQAYVDHTVDGVKRLVWSLRYCPGALMDEVEPHSDGLLRSFGRTMAILDLALKSFSHPAMKQGNKWELTKAAEARPFAKYLGRDAAIDMDAIFNQFEETTQAKLASLPHSVIHNDANNSNVLVNVTESGDEIVDGVIDFGDMTYQPTVCEAAIAMAYVAVHNDDPLAACSRFLESYSELFRLNDDEIAVLYDLMLTRMAVSVSIAAERQHVDPDDELGQQDREPTIRGARRLAGISRQEATDAFGQARSGTSN
jgi:Ser/Thr protein kinase RdoA (MazF antagonist)